MPPETINILLALLAFGAFHSLSASITFKALSAALTGERAYLGLYRLLYNVVSVITLFPVLALAATNPGENIWETEGVIALVMMAIQGTGLLGLLISLLQIDLMRFIGFTQLMAYLTGGKLPLPSEPLISSGVYGLVRHPLYFFSLLFLWGMPTMSAAAFGLAIGATLYFTLGSLLEERKMLKYFGADYAAYQQQVAWMIPFVKAKFKMQNSK